MLSFFGDIDKVAFELRIHDLTGKNKNILAIFI